MYHRYEVGLPILAVELAFVNYIPIYIFFLRNVSGFGILFPQVSELSRPYVLNLFFLLLHHHHHHPVITIAATITSTSPFSCSSVSLYACYTHAHTR